MRSGLRQPPSLFSRECFNEAAGADPADARAYSVLAIPRWRTTSCFNEAAGADPADASR